MAIAADGAARELERFRAAVLSDGALQGALQAPDDVDSFVALALAAARAREFEISEDGLRQALRPDPIGLSRFSGAPAGGSLPQSGWLPINVLPAPDGFQVDWAWFGEQPLTEPFFEDSVRRVMRLPLNRLARHRTRLADLAAAARYAAALTPSGFIFHMSRCGSTLVSQMLAADPRNVVISEASPIDAVVRLDFGAKESEAHAALLATMVGALGRRRAPAQTHYFVKLDSWHTLSLPLFRRAFPAVPWIFLYRDPAEVLGSQMLQRGIQTVPEYLPPRLFGMTFEDSLDSDDYCARVLARTCEAVLAPHAQGGGLLVNYHELPGALWSRILPHFGVACGAEEQGRMAAAAQFDAKSPQMLFSADNKTKRDIMTGALRATATRHIGAVYERLESLRRGAGA